MKDPLFFSVSPSSEHNNLGYNDISAVHDIGQGIACEAVFTFILVFSVLGCTDEHRPFFGSPALGIGLTVGVLHLALVGPPQYISFLPCPTLPYPIHPYPTPPHLTLLNTISPYSTSCMQTYPLPDLTQPYHNSPNHAQPQSTLPYPTLPRRNLPYLVHQIVF